MLLEDLRRLGESLINRIAAAAAVRLLMHQHRPCHPCSGHRHNHRYLLLLQALLREPRLRSTLIVLYTNCSVIVHCSCKNGSYLVSSPRVIQCCPMYASLFELAIQRHLSLAASSLAPKELIQACTDDILIVIRTIEFLLLVCKAVRYLARVSLCLEY